MKKIEAIKKLNENSNFGLNSSNTHFANINAAQIQGRRFWWIEVSSHKFCVGFYFLLYDENEALTLLKIPKNILKLADLSYREAKDCYGFRICSDLRDNLYMHDLVGQGKVNLTSFIVYQIGLEQYVVVLVQ